jgi:hypothetical protein
MRCEAAFPANKVPQGIGSYARNNFLYVSERILILETVHSARKSQQTFEMVIFLGSDFRGRYKFEMTEFQ